VGEKSGGAEKKGKRMEKAILQGSIKNPQGTDLGKIGWKKKKR